MSIRCVYILEENRFETGILHPVVLIDFLVTSIQCHIYMKPMDDKTGQAMDLCVRTRCTGVSMVGLKPALRRSYFSTCSSTKP